jgi:hypothetical protein
MAWLRILAMGFAVTKDSGVDCSRGPRVACGGLGRVGFVAGDLNKPEYEEDPTGEENAYEQAVSGRNDFAYYYLDNARGQVMALLARDMQYGVNTPGEGGGEDQDKARTLEYYKYNAFGSVTVLPVYDRDDSSYSHVETTGGYSFQADDIPGSGSRTDWDLVENTPLTLSDNNTLMLNRRNGDNGHNPVGARYGRESQFFNSCILLEERMSPELGILDGDGGGSGPCEPTADLKIDWVKRRDCFDQCQKNSNPV